MGNGGMRNGGAAERRPSAPQRAMSHPRVSHQVETNVVTQVERPPVTSRESDPAAPPRAAADDRRNSVLGRVFRASVHPTCRTILGGGSLCLLLTVQCGAQTAGPPLVLQGTIPGGRAGRGMANGSSTDPRAGDLSSRWGAGRQDRSDRAIPSVGSTLAAAVS